MFHCATVVGFGTKSHVHAVGDGAEWISAQVEKKFGERSSIWLISIMRAIT